MPPVAVKGPAYSVVEPIGSFTVKKGEDRYCLYFDRYLAGFIALASLS